MKKPTVEARRFAGLDVHAVTIAVSVAEKDGLYGSAVSSSADFSVIPSAVALNGF